MHVSQFLSLARQRRFDLQQALAALPAEFARHDARRQELQQLREQTLDELAQVNLPTLDQPALNAVEAWTGYGRFRGLNLTDYLAREQNRLTQRAAEIRADARFIRRQELLDPTAGELTLRAKQAGDELTLIESGLQRYEQEPDFVSLYRRGYRTPSYRQSILTLQYYKDWKRGDEITEKFGCKAFSEVRAAYEHLLRGREVCQKTLQGIEGEIQDVRRLIAELNETQRRLADLPAFVLADFRRMLREHLAFANREQLFQWAGGDRVRESLIKRLDGIEKQLEYTTALAGRQLNEERQYLTTEIGKLERKLTKFSRPKYAGTQLRPADAQSWLRDPRERLAARRQRFWRDYDRVAYYDRYDRYDFASDLLWWDVMTDGRLDGDFIPEVYQYRQMHPGYTYQSPTEPYRYGVDVS
ncbi:MAG: hypothetical protein SNJ67_11630 [Chloracidobacterium sp.]|uniref:Uncharacterized protein n=1 Tax=Chloracidobacterium validum TaxID=2821543 RepID=A0ABX8BDR3_9BACT|nr:hypothetical protein [Chloracidobacterium validum]QUW04015.1 hypothetical protein J8C06_13250 [Chloracidobacterium validum]